MGASILDKDPQQMSWAELKDYISAVSEQIAESRKAAEESRKAAEESRKEYDKRLEESRKEYDKRLEESRKAAEESRKEYDKRAEESRKEYDKRAEESRKAAEESRKQREAEFAKTQKNIDEMTATLKYLMKKNSQADNDWGRFLEEMCIPACIDIFQKEGIHITQRYTGITHAKNDEGEEMEVDAILCNTTEAVVLEVKSTCNQEDVDHFLKQLKIFKQVFHPFDKYDVYAAIVGMKFQKGIKIYARRQGLYVIDCVAESVFELAMRPEEGKRFCLKAERD